MLPAVIDDSRSVFSERHVYDCIKNDLSDEWTAVHSLGLTIHDRKPWTEVDFVLIGPTGVYCIEVKGGTKIERIDRVWRYTDKAGRTIKKTESPFQQAGSAAAALRSYLVGKNSTLDDIVVGYGVATPLVDFSIDGPDIERQIVFDSTSVSAGFDSYVDRIGEYWLNELHRRTGRKKSGLTPIQRALVLRLIQPDFSLTQSLSSNINRVNTELIRLTKEQREVLRGLKANERAVIRGGAGTGKTLLALNYAVSEARQGKKVFFSCFSRRLGNCLAGEDIAQGIPTLTITNLHQFMKKCIDDTNRTSLLPKASHDDLFQVFFPEQCIEALLELGLTSSFDLIVIDEGQDLLVDGYLDVIEQLLNGGFGKGHWRFFMDANQAVFGSVQPRGMNRLKKGNPARFNLTANCRNTREISIHTSLLSRVYSGALSNLETDGLDVEELWWSTPEEQRREVSRFVGRAIQKGAAPHEITVLSKSRLENSGLSAGLVGLPHRISEDGELNCVGFSSISGFKGLENDIVVVIDVDDLDSKRARRDLYVATSRARVLLAIALNNNVKTDYEISGRDFGLWHAKHQES
jgi:hypothetical protein